MAANVVCYGIIRSLSCQQEWYETAARTASRRAAELRRQGFRVVVSPMGFQVTPVGTLKMSLLSVLGLTPAQAVPAPARIDRF